MAIPVTSRMRKGSSALAAIFSFWLCAMFRRNSFRRCNLPDAMRNTALNSGSPAGFSFARTAHISTHSRFRTSFSQTCLEGAAPRFRRQPRFSSEKDLSNTLAEKFTFSTSRGSRRSRASAIRSSKITSTITQSLIPQSLHSRLSRESVEPEERRLGFVVPHFSKSRDGAPVVLWLIEGRGILAPQTRDYRQHECDYLAPGEAERSDVEESPLS